MILRFFRSNQPILIAALPLVTLIYWLPGWTTTTGPVQGFNLLQFVFEQIGFFKLHGSVSGAITMLLGAFVFNSFFQQFDLIDRKNQLPGLCFVLAFSWSPNIIYYNHVLIAFIFLLFTIKRMMTIYRQPIVHRELFDSGLLLAVASIFYLPFAFFLAAIWVAVLVLRPFNWREILMPLVGFVTAAFIFGSLNYLFEWGALNSLFTQMDLPLRLVSVTPIMWLRYLIVTVLVILVAIAGKSFIAAMNRSTTRNQNLKIVLLAFAINALLIFGGLWLYPETASNNYLLSLPLALVLVYAVADGKVNWMVTTVFYLFILLTLVNNYSLFLQE